MQAELKKRENPVKNMSKSSKLNWNNREKEKESQNATHLKHFKRPEIYNIGNVKKKLNSFKQGIRIEYPRKEEQK